MIGYFHKGAAYEAAAALESLPAADHEKRLSAFTSLEKGVRQIADHLRSEVLHG